MMIPFRPKRYVVESRRTAYYLFTKIDALNLKHRLINTSGYDLIASLRNSHPLIFRFENESNTPGLARGRLNAVLWAAFSDTPNGCRIEIEIVSGVLTWILLGLFTFPCLVSLLFNGFTLGAMMFLILPILLLAIADSYEKRRVSREFEKLVKSL